LFANVNYAYDAPVAGQSPVQGTAATGVVVVNNGVIVTPKSQIILESTATGTATSQNLQIVAAVDPQYANTGYTPLFNGKLKVEWVEDSNLGSGVTAWNTIGQWSGPYAFINASIPLPGTVNLADIAVRITFSFDNPNNAPLTGLNRSFYCYIYDVAITGNSGSSTQTNTNPVYYCVAERFVDSSNTRHESPPTDWSAATSLNGQTGIAVTLPSQRANQCSTSYVIYRSNAEVGGGYPYMWEVGTANITDTIFNDVFALGNPVDTLPQQGLNLIPTLTVFYPDSSSVTSSINDPPPSARKTLLFQGSIVYIPS
jgi:hypothetical protein